ncbi:MAG: hypothetical protein V1844_09930 [Pseudomonadota bacterium]
MVSITSATETVTLNESVPDSDYGDIEPRITRTATLDGGSVIASSGCSHSDRTIAVVASNISALQESVLSRIAKQALIIQLSNYEGVFSGAISRLSCKAGKVEFTFLVKEKLTQD